MNVNNYNYCYLIYRSVKWWKRIFFHLLDLCIVNANILYNERNPQHQLSQLEFQQSLILSLLEGHNRHIPHRRYGPNRELPMRLTERPFLEKICSDTPHGGRPQCEVCRARGKRSQTRHQCKLWKTPLHVNECFEVYHTVLNYHQP